MFTNDELATERIVICNSCPSYKDGLCSSCGCVMALKVMIKTAQCPDKKWGVDETPIKEN